jgi:hypothetical protein
LKIDASIGLFEKCSKVLIEVEIASKGRAERDFVNKYMKIVCENPRNGAGEHYQLQDNRAGFTGRVYFDGPEWLGGQMGMGSFFYVEKRAGQAGYRSAYAFRINNNALFWKLIAAGYRIGENRIGGGRLEVPVIAASHPTEVPTPVPTPTSPR